MKLFIRNYGIALGVGIISGIVFGLLLNSFILGFVLGILLAIFFTPFMKFDKKIKSGGDCIRNSNWDCYWLAL